MFPLNLDKKLNLEEKYLCLDFINTLDWRRRDPPIETLTGYNDLLDWVHETGLVEAVEVQVLREKAELDQDEAGFVLSRAVELRETAYTVIMAAIQGQAVSEDDLERLNQFFSAALSRARLVQTAEGFELGWPEDHQKLDWFLWPIAHSVVDLLTSAELDRVKECSSDQGCGWLFYDTSRNKSRRWCSMESCGNRAKATNFYHRHKQEN